MRWNQCIAKCFKIQNHLLHVRKWNFSQSWNYRYMSVRQTLYITQFASLQKKSIRLTEKCNFQFMQFSQIISMYYTVLMHMGYSLISFSENKENMKSGLMLSEWTDFILILFYVSFPLCFFLILMTILPTKCFRNRTAFEKQWVCARKVIH